MKFSIRIVTEDLSDICDLYRKYENEKFMYADDKFFYKLLSKSEEASILAGVSEDKIIGFAYVLKHIGRAGWLGGLFVKPNQRRKGVGTKLVNACLKRLSNWGCEDIFLFTDSRNKPANCLFKKLGFNLAYQRLELTKRIDLGRRKKPRNLKNVDINPEFKEAKDFIFNSPELQMTNGSIPLYYYPVVLGDELLKRLIRNGKVITCKQGGDIKGMVIFQRAPVIRSDHRDFILREELVKEIQPREHKGEINFITGQKESVKNLISYVQRLFARRGVRELIHYSFISSPHLSLLKSETFSRSSRRLNVMRYTYV